MWEPGNSTSSWTMEGPSSFHSVTPEIHVLLVDHDKDSLTYMARMLKFYSYKVTELQSGLAALSMISDGKEQFDLLLTDIRLADIDGFMLLQQAGSRELPTILMSADEDAMVAKIALENGACFFLEKPVGKKVLKSLWQYVIKERLSKVKFFENKDSLHEPSNQKRNSTESMENYFEERNESDSNSKKIKDGSKKKVRSGKGTNVDEEGGSDKGKRKTAKDKFCTEWTEELHSRFMAAVHHLGEGIRIDRVLDVSNTPQLELGCYPREILDLMNVPGLTRMQVASHLQKCRNDNWRAPETRKAAPTSSANNGSHYKFASRKFGSMPRLVKSSSCPQTSQLQETWSNQITWGNLAGSEIYSPLGQSFLGNREGEHTVQLINSQVQMAPNCFGDNMLTNNSGMQSIGQLGACGSDVICHGDYVNGTSSNNGDENLATLLEMTSNIQNPQPVSSEFSNATFGADSHSSSLNQNPVPDDFFDFLPEFEDSKLLGGSSMVNYGSIPETCIFDVEPIFFDQNQRRQT